MTKAGYACNLILYIQKVTGFAVQKREKGNYQLPAVRCDHSYKKRVMAHANNKCNSYAEYITNLINNDLKLSDEIRFVRSEGKKTYIEISINIPSDLKEHLDKVKANTNVSISEQIRKELMKANGVRELEIDELLTLTQTNNLLIALGRNLNQLTRRANANNAVQIPNDLIKDLIRIVDRTSVDINNLFGKLGF